MSSDQSFLSRVFKGAIPRPVASYGPPPEELAPGLWSLERHLLHFGLARLPSRTTIVRLESGGLLVVAPPPVFDSTCVAAIDALGTVEYALVPNSFHYLFASAFRAHYPSARVLAVPGLSQRVPELDFVEELGAEPPKAWVGELRYEILSGRGVSEVILFHVPTGTLILTDLAFNMTRFPRRFDRWIWRSSGVPKRFGPARTTRSFLLTDRAEVSRCLAVVLEWPIERIVVAHGDAVETDAVSELRRAFAQYLT